MTVDISPNLADDPRFANTHRPAWAPAGTRPNYETLDHHGRPIQTWVRNIGRAVWITAEDCIVDGGQPQRGPTRIHYEAPTSLDPHQAVTLARDLYTASQLVNRLENSR